MKNLFLGIMLLTLSTPVFASICGSPVQEVLDAETQVTNDISNRSTALSKSLHKVLSEFSKKNGSSTFSFTVRADSEIKAIFRNNVIEVLISAEDDTYTTNVSVYMSKNCVTGVVDYITEEKDYKIDVSSFYRRTKPTGRVCLDMPWMC